MSSVVRKSLLVSALASALLLGCSKEESSDVAGGLNSTAAKAQASAKPAAPKAQNGGPVEMMEQAVNHLRTNDLRGLLQVVLPADDYKKMANDWVEARKEKISDEDRKEFADGLAKLTGPGAIDKMMEELEPKLGELKVQLPFLISMGMMTAQNAIQSDENLTDVQKEQATTMLGAAQSWATTTDFADPNRLRKALTEFANGAKATKITSLDQLQALSFDQVLDKGGVMFGASKRAFSAYGLDLNEMLATFKAEQISMSGDTAKVRTSMKFFGKEITSDTEMVRENGKWISKESAEVMSRIAEAGENAEAEETEKEGAGQ